MTGTTIATAVGMGDHQNWTCFTHDGFWTSAMALVGSDVDDLLLFVLLQLQHTALAEKWTPWLFVLVDRQD